MGDNANFVRRWFEEVWNNGRAEAIDELLAPDVLIHGLAEGELAGPQAFHDFYKSFRTAFSDIHIRVEKTIEDATCSAAWCSVTATHRESGTSVAFTGTVMGEIQDGRLKEGWNSWDFLGLLTQLGAVDAATVGPLLGAE